MLGKNVAMRRGLQMRLGHTYRCSHPTRAYKSQNVAPVAKERLKTSGRDTRECVAIMQSVTSPWDCSTFRIKKNQRVEREGPIIKRRSLMQT